MDTAIILHGKTNRLALVISLILVNISIISFIIDIYIALYAFHPLDFIGSITLSISLLVIGLVFLYYHSFGRDVIIRGNCISNPSFDMNKRIAYINANEINYFHRGINKKKNQIYVISIFLKNKKQFDYYEETTPGVTRELLLFFAKNNIIEK